MKIESDIRNESSEPIVIISMEEAEGTIAVPEELPLAAETESNTSKELKDAIVPKSVEEVVDTPPPMSEEFSEILNFQI